MLRRRLSEILTPNVVNVSPTTSVSEVIRTMHSKNISCIVVVEANKPIGIFTERNVVQVLAERGPDFDGREIRALMSSPVLTANQNVEVHIAYNLLVTHKIRRLVVVDDEGSVVGVITQSNLIEHLGYEYFIEIKKVSQIMTKILFTISKDMTVPQALRGMARESLSCLVIAQDDRPVGILTERDVARLSVDRGDIWKLKVEQVMSSPVQTLSQQTPVHEAAKIMQNKNVRRVVVVDMDGKIVGLITQSDIVKGLEGKYIETLKEVIKEKDVKIESTSRDLAEKTVYLDNILHSSVDMGIVATDLNFRIAYFNPGAEKILGYAAQEVIGRNAREIHRQEGVELSRFDKVIEAIPKNKTHAFSFERSENNGRRFIRARVSGIWDKEDIPVGFVFMLRDITERKQAEEAQRESERRLYREQKRMEMLEFANNLALQLMDELRNPLVAVGGFAARISNGDYPEDKLREYAGLIFKESKRLDTALEQAVAHLKAAAERA
ncbi:MAG: CBS domain-containing protein [Deltaproteobacteria bacterium]|jgi:PAS domain S-box-containing protein